jgi:Amt family ammonium transporter
MIGILCYGVFTVLCAGGLFLGLKATLGIRVSEEEEIEGLDLSEHGMHAYDVHPGGSQFDELGSRVVSGSPARRQLATESSSS